MKFSFFSIIFMLISTFGFSQTVKPKTPSRYTIKGVPVSEKKIDSIINLAIRKTLQSAKKKGYIS